MNFRNIIPQKHLMSEGLLQEFRNFIEKNMPPKKLEDLELTMIN